MRAGAICSMMPLRASTRIEREVCGRRARHHVPGVLHVTGSVGDDELAARRREVAIRHVDGDALFAFGAQTVGEEREVHALLAAQHGGVLQRFEGVLEDLLRVIEQAADERRLAVVDGSGRREP